MLAAGASADVQRRLQTIGIQRAIGVSRTAGRGRVRDRGGARRPGRRRDRAGGGRAGGERAEHAAARGAQRAAARRGAAARPRRSPSWRSRSSSGSPPRGPPGARRGGRPSRCCAAPSWAPSRPRRLALAAGGFGALGARLALARRGRAAATLVVLTVSGAVILLMLGLASLVAALRDDPGSVGKRYQLTANLDPSALPAVRAIPGVADAGARYVVRGADSFALGEPVELLAFDGDHTRFEDPPLASGRRVRGRRRGRDRRRARPGARDRPRRDARGPAALAAARRGSASSGRSARSTRTAASRTCGRGRSSTTTRALRRRSSSG